MKHLKLFFILLVFVLANGFCQGYSGSEDAGQKRIPITWGIVSTLQEDGEELKELDYFISKPFTIKMAAQDRAGRMSIIDRGIAANNEQHSPEEVYDFTLSEAGVLHSFYPAPRGSEIFEIAFKERTIILRFGRTRAQSALAQDGFALVSFMIDTKNYIPVSDVELPQLMVNGPALHKPTEVQAVPISAAPMGGAAGGRLSDAANRPPEGNRRPDFGTYSHAIMGQGLLEEGDVVAYIMSQKTAMADRQQVAALVSAYINEAQKENVNHDIAIAQMWYATSSLSDKERLKSHNYAGLSPVGKEPVSFPQMRTGVIAHIQHLKGYASKDAPRGDIVDPRFRILVSGGIQGTARTLEELSSVWTQNSRNYESSISRILETLHGFNGP